MSFPSFTKLPAELRSMVWTYALPEPQVYEILDTPYSTLKTPASTGLMFASTSHDAPPILAAACRESRVFVLHRYRPLTLSDTTKYINPKQDLILLEPYLLIKRLLRVLHSLAEIDFMKINMRRVAFGTSYGFSTGIFHPILSGRVSKNNMKMLLRKLERFPHLKRVLFVVHEEFKCTVPESPVAEWPYRLQLNFHDLSKHDDDVNSRITWHFHRNELQYYPLQTEDMEQDDIDMIASVSDGEEDDAVELNRKPTNDDWRRFKRRFLKAVYSTLTKGPREKPPQELLPLRIDGASLSWTYRGS